MQLKELGFHKVAGPLFGKMRAAYPVLERRVSANLPEGIIGRRAEDLKNIKPNWTERGYDRRQWFGTEKDRGLFMDLIENIGKSRSNKGRRFTDK